MKDAAIQLVRWSTETGIKMGFINGDDSETGVPIAEDLPTIFGICRARGITVSEWARERLREVDKIVEIDPGKRIKPIELSELWGAEMGQEEKGGIGDVSFFFKATGVRVADPYHVVGLRPDAAWHVPEPTLTAVFDDQGDVFGYTIGLDITARDFESPGNRHQASSKIFHLSASIGPGMALIGSINAATLVMTMEIHRRGGKLFHETTHLDIPVNAEELGEKLSRAMPLFPWTCVMMGNVVRTPSEFQLEDGDEIAITVPGIGTLRNTAKIINPSWADVPTGSSRILCIDPRDTVAVSLGTLSQGQKIRVGNTWIDVRQDIPFGHKVAVEAMAQGDWVIKYGEKIGVASIDIWPGEHVHTHNLESSRGRGDLAVKEGRVG